MKTLADYQTPYGKANYPWENKPTPPTAITSPTEVPWRDTHDLNKPTSQVFEEVWEEMNLPEDKRQKIRDELPMVFKQQ